MNRYDYCFDTVVDVLVSECGITPESITAESTLQGDLGMDSVGLFVLGFGTREPVRDVPWRGYKSSTRDGRRHCIALERPIAGASGCVLEPSDRRFSMPPHTVRASDFLVRPRAQYGLFLPSLTRTCPLVASALQERGLKPGETFAIVLPTAPEFYSAFLECVTRRRCTDRALSSSSIRSSR